MIWEDKTLKIDERSYMVYVDSINIKDGYVAFSYKVLTEYLGQHVLLVSSSISVPYGEARLQDVDTKEVISFVLDQVVNEKLVKYYWDKLEPLVRESVMNKKQNFPAKQQQEIITQ